MMLEMLSMDDILGTGLNDEPLVRKIMLIVVSKAKFTLLRLWPRLLRKRQCKRALKAHSDEGAFSHWNWLLHKAKN